MQKITKSNYWKARKRSNTVHTRIVSKYHESQPEEALTGQGGAICASVSIITAMDRNISDVTS